MTTTDNQLFSVEEALARLGENRAQGSLVVTKNKELSTLYVRDGYIIRAQAGQRRGEEAVTYALHLSESSYEWTRGAKPPDAEQAMRVHIREFVGLHGNVHKEKIAETGKLRFNGTEQPSGEGSIYNYFLIPSQLLSVRLPLTRSVTVLGRDSSSDLIIDRDTNVSGRHCIVEVQKRGLYVLDLASTNGTYINGVLVRDGYINPGDILELGTYRLEVYRELRNQAMALSAR